MHVDDLFVAGCLQDLEGVLEALRMLTLDRRRETQKCSTWHHGLCVTRCGLEIHGGPKHAAMLLKYGGMDTCKPISSPHVTDTRTLETSANETRAHMPAIEARKYWSAVVRMVYVAQDRPDLDVVASTLAKTMAHAKFGDEFLVGTSREGHVVSRCTYTNTRPRSWCTLFSARVFVSFLSPA